MVVEALYITSKVLLIVAFFALSIVLLVLSSQAKIFKQAFKNIQDAIFAHKAHLSINKLIIPTLLIFFVIDQVIKVGLEEDSRVSKFNEMVGTLSGVAGFVSQVKNIKEKTKNDSN